MSGDPDIVVKPTQMSYLVVDHLAKKIQIRHLFAASRAATGSHMLELELRIQQTGRDIEKDRPASSRDFAKMGPHTRGMVGLYWKTPSVSHNHCH